MNIVLEWIKNNPILFVAIILVIYVVLTYNNLNAKRERVKKSFSKIDVYLQARFDKISALLEQTLKSYDHESEVFKTVSRLRSGITKAEEEGSINSKVNAENELRTFLANPMIKTEAYPLLTSITSLGMETAKQTVLSEKDLAAARNQYNSNVTSFNTKIKSFPAVIIASIFGFNHPFELFKVDEEAKARPSLYQTEKAKAESEIDIANMKKGS